MSIEDQAMQAAPLIRRVTRDVSAHFRAFLQGIGLKAQFAAPSKAAANRYKHWLDDFGEDQSEILISPPYDREGDEDIYKPNRAIVN